MGSRRYVKVVAGRLWLVEERFEQEVCPNTGESFEGLEDVLEIEVTADVHADLLVHFDALGRAPKPAPRKPAGGTDRFDEAWQLYPRRDAKAEARKAWAANGCDKAFDEIRSDIARRAVGDDWAKDGGKFVPYMATYIRQKRWLDEPVQADQESFL